MYRNGPLQHGLTPASSLFTGYTISTPVTPVNPESGGASVDGNWELATPYPSGPTTNRRRIRVLAIFLQSSTDPLNCDLWCFRLFCRFQIYHSFQHTKCGICFASKQLS
jgi:hypothetical protein